MAFAIEQFHNPYLAPGKGRVDVILTVTADAGGTTARPALDRVVGFILDHSGSMHGPRIAAVKEAVATALDLLEPGTRFFVAVFNDRGHLLVPTTVASPEAGAAAKRQVQNLQAGSGTAMSTGLAVANAEFAKYPEAIRYAVFLTDGKNESEHIGAVRAILPACLFECDCWGVGTDWTVGEVQEIAQALHGKASLIPDPSGIGAAFQAAMGKAQAKAIQDVRLRLWAPAVVKTAFVKQVAPTIEDLTVRAVSASAQARDYPTGSWAPGESRDYHVAVDVPVGGTGDEVLALRPSVVLRERAGDTEVKPTEARVLVTWTAEDDDRSARIEPHVAHYTGQADLAQAIQAGLEKREQGDEAAATTLLGRAVQLAHESGNDELTARLRKVVDVVDATTGTVRLRKSVDKAAEMDLSLEATTTKRMRREPAGGA